MVTLQQVAFHQIISVHFWNIWRNWGQGSLSQRAMYLGDILKIVHHSDSCCGTLGSSPHIPLSAWCLFLFPRTHPLRLPLDLPYLWWEGAFGGGGLLGASEERRMEAFGARGAIGGR